MRISTKGAGTAALTTAFLLCNGAAFAQAKVADCQNAGAPEEVAGHIVSIQNGAPPNGTQGKLTVRSDDGTLHEFQANNETLQNFKVGDPIKAKLRSSPNSTGAAGKAPKC